METHFRRFSLKEMDQLPDNMHLFLFVFFPLVILKAVGLASLLCCPNSKAEETSMDFINNHAVIAHGGTAIYEDSGRSLFWQ